MAEPQKMRRKKRIGYVLRRFPVLSETFILNEILALEALGTSVEIYSLLQPRDPRFHEGIARLKANIRYIPNLSNLKSLLRYNQRAANSFRGRYWPLLIRCAATLRPALVWRFFQAAYVAERAREQKVEHLHAHFAHRPTSVARLASKLSGIPYSFTAHAMDIYKNDVNKGVLAKKINEAQFVVTVSEANLYFLRQRAPSSVAKLIKINNGIDMSKFAPKSDQVTARGKFQFLCVARLVEKKGIEYLINACALLKQKELDFHLNIIGKGKLRPKISKMITDLDLDENVKLVGIVTQDEIISYYDKADAFVLPCLVADDGNREGLPVSLVEALACGIPAISTPVAGIPEVLRDGENGLLVAERDAVELMEAMSKLLIDRRLHRQLQDRARASVEKNFDAKRTAQQLNDLLTEGQIKPSRTPLSAGS